MTIEADASAPQSQSLAILRFAVGLTQGIALYFFYHSYTAKSWPATDGALFAPLLLVFIFVPIIVVAAAGNVRTRTLIIWTIASAVILAGLGWHDILRDPVVSDSAQAARNLPSPILIATAAAGLFIAHSLIVAGNADRRFIASYPRYFDVAWKHGVQALLALVFVGAFWALLWLGAALFALIQIGAFATTIRQPWFAAPATTLAFAYAIHVTDVRAGLVRGARTLKLTLLSWLLPVMAGLAAAFLIALIVTGLDPLWRTRRAAYVLLSAAGALVLLVNAAYQDGSPLRAANRVLRYAGLVAAAALIPLGALAGYALWLRVSQYGWTTDRIILLACVVIAASYAIGYAVAALNTRQWLKWLEATNVVTAFIILGIMLALLTPLADPARISAADQMQRLKSGAVTPERFDYHFLRFSAGRYGREALTQLAADRSSPQAIAIADRAAAALRQQSRWARSAPPPVEATPETRRANISVYPPGATLPDTFLQQDWQGQMDGQRRWQLPGCLTGGARCDAMLLDIDGDGAAEVVLFSSPSGVASVFKFAGSAWSVLGTLANVGCPGVREAIREGRANVLDSPFKEIEAGGQRLRISVGCQAPEKK